MSKHTTDAMAHAPASRPFVPVNVAILTVSDSRSSDNDLSGDILQQRVLESGHHVVKRQITPDNMQQLVAVLTQWVRNPDIDVILTTGGTGLTGRDITVEAHRQVYEKEIEAFATVFSHVSMSKIGTSAIQSRATGGVAQGTYLFALPGSPSACRDAWDQVLKPQLDYRHQPCNLVEIMPRLNEHRSTNTAEKTHS